MSARPPTVHERLDGLGSTLEAILAQTRATNGRVTRLEEEVFGEDKHRTPGLLSEFRDIKKLVYDARAVVRVTKWVLPLVVPGSVAAIATAVKTLAA